MFHTPLEPHSSLSIYPPLFSDHKSDRHRNPLQYQVVYEEEQKLGYCDTGWRFHQTPPPIIIPLKQNQGPQRHHKIVNSSSRGE